MISDQVNSWFQANKLGMILALVGIVLIGCGVFWYKSGQVAQPTVQILSATDEQKISNSIYIDVSGAVNQPGVYQVEANSRIGAVLKVAGGISSEANLEWIAKNLNQASQVKDGMKLYIPSKSEAVQAQSDSLKSTNGNTNINSASQSELESLPGIGPVTATKIIQGRQYQNSEELLSKKVVGQKVYDQIKDLISTW